ncbi:MAG TPA: heme biosynthesis HemY N-terminal domain-containing protein [Pseudomonadales bacterium]
MKFALLVLALALVLGGIVGVLVARDPGYVLVAYQNLALETSLWFALLVLVALYALLALAVFVVTRLLRGSGRLKGWNARRRTRAARDQTVRGLLLMAEGRWAEARKLLEAAAPRVPAPLINYLHAARAAHAMGDARGRDALLRAAHESTPGSRLAVGLTQAELQRADGQWEACLATTLQLYRQAPRHPQVLRQLVDCYRHLRDWQAILELVGDLRKQRVMPDAELRALEREAWQGRLAAGRDAPEALWKSVPRELRRDPALAEAFALAFARAGRGSEAEALLREVLDQVWSTELVGLYGKLMNADPPTQLLAAERWLKERPNDPDLLLALGRISLMNRQWAKAREYLEASLRLKRSAETQGELGRLCAALGDAERGGELLTQALENLPALPMPERQAAAS